MILTLVFVGIRGVDEDLASSALDEKKKKKKAADCNAAAVKWLMLIIYGNRHVCAPSDSFGPCTHTHTYTGYTLNTNPRVYIPVPE